MDLHLNELIIEEGFDSVPLKSVSFRDIDQEFIIVLSESSYGSLTWNNLYYCFIKPYEGLFFRLIGISDEDDNALKVDEDKSDIEDTPYKEFANETISKIVENGDLISNQLIVDLPFDYYNGNPEYSELMKTRSLKWLDDKRIEGNPDWIQVKAEGETIDLKLLKCHEDGVVAETNGGQKYLFTPDGRAVSYTE